MAGEQLANIDSQNVNDEVWLKLAKRLVVRSTRLASGIVLRNNEVNDDKMGFVASEEFTPGKARVLLQLALTKTKHPLQIQKMFSEY